MVSQYMTALARQRDGAVLQSRAMSDAPAALVTGASRGLGRGIAEALAADGLDLAIHYGGNRAAADETLAALGRLDALVNNAGMAPRVRADLLEASEESFDELVAVNLKGPYFLSQLAARHWLESGQR